MTEQTQPNPSTSGCTPLVGVAAAAFSLLLGIFAGSIGLYAFLALSDRGLEQLGLIETIEAPGPGESEPYPLAHPLAATLEIQESLDGQSVHRRLREDRQLFTTCYAEELDRSPQTRGEIAFQFSVDTTGDVVATVVRENRAGSDALAECVLDAIEQEWSFPEPDTSGVATVRFHVLFVPLGAAES